MSNVIVVTGGSSGIGKAIAEHLHSKGHIVYGTSRKARSTSDTTFHMLEMDVTDESSIQQAIDQVIQKEGKLDVLVNNAGLGMTGPMENSSAKELDLIFQTNVYGVMNVCRKAIPFLREAKGKIINITSIGGRFALPYRGVYCASKFAVEGLSEALSMELLPHGIDVSIIQPGDVKTNINNNRHTAEEVDLSTYPNFNEVLDQVNQEVNDAQDPILVARTVEKIINTSSPKLRYRVATFTQKLGLVLHWFLPGKIFAKLIARYYGLRKSNP